MLPRLCTAFCFVTLLAARAGYFDSSFNSALYGSASIRDVAIDRTGRVYVSGDFLKANGIAVGNFIRLTPVGTFDGGFSLGKTVDGPVTRILPLTDGRICILGTFTRVNGASRQNIAMLTLDGTLDAKFAPPSGVLPGTPTHVALDKSGRILVACRGSAQASGSVVLVRLLASGARDNTFPLPIATRVPGLYFSGPNGPGPFGANYVQALSNGQILLGGDFGACNGVSNTYLALFSENGTVVPTFHSPLVAAPTNGFNVPTKPQGVLTGAPVASGNGIVLGGNFANAGNVNQQGLVQLTSSLGVTGTFQSHLTPIPPSSSPTVRRVAAPAQIPIVAIVGDYSKVWNVSSLGAAIVSTTSGGPVGKPGNISFGGVDVVSMRSDGFTVFGHATPASIDGVLQPSLRAYSNSGNLSPQFASRLLGPGRPSFAAVRPGNGVITGGEWLSEIGTTPFSGLAALDNHGARDGSFACSVTPVNSVKFTLPLPGNLYLIGGAFTRMNDIDSKYLAIIDERGTLVRSFNSIEAPDQPVDGASLLPNGKVLLRGSFTTVWEHATRTLAVLDLSQSDDIIDISFTCDIPNLTSVTSAAGLPDGSIVIGGLFTDLGGMGINGLAKLSATGTLDPTFHPLTSFVNAEVQAITVDPAGRILAGGGFYTASTARHLIRFLPDGRIDPSLSESASEGVISVQALEVQPDSRIYVLGTFNNLDFTVQVERLFDDGSLDSSLYLYGYAGVEGFAVAPPGRLYVWGELGKGTVPFRLFDDRPAIVNERLPSGLMAFVLEQPVKPGLKLYPARVSASVGDKVVFTALTSGSSETYAWTHNGKSIPGEAEPTLTIEAASANAGGTYALTATNSAGSTTVSSILSMPPIPTPTPAPSVNVPSSFSPKLYTVLQKGRPGIRGTVSDPDGVKRIDVLVGRKKVGQFRSTNWTITLDKPPVKPVKVTVIVTDRDGRKSRHSYNVSIVTLVGG